MNEKTSSTEFPKTLIVGFLAVAIGFVGLERWSSTEVDESAYSMVLLLAENCQRDDCDLIIDSLSDGKIDIRESTAIMFMESVGETSDIENAKNKLLNLVNSDDRFRGRG